MILLVEVLRVSLCRGQIPHSPSDVTRRFYVYKTGQIEGEALGMTEQTKQGQSNEELAILAQQGDKRALYRLWQQIETLVCMICGRVYQYRKDRADRAGVAEEDMRQEGYFAFLDAVQAYSPASGYRFTTYLHYPLQNRINALLGVRTVRTIKAHFATVLALTRRFRAVTMKI